VSDTNGCAPSRPRRVRILSSAGLAIGLTVTITPLSLTNQAAGQEAASEIIVTNNSDASNGDTSTAAALMANPGEDGISLREAMEVTNNDPGSYSVVFDPSLAGTTIGITEFGLPGLSGGGVSIDGDIDGNGDADVTIRNASDGVLVWGLFISGSSDNHLNALRLRGPFAFGVILQPPGPYLGVPLPTYETYSDNTVSNMVISNVSEGIAMRSALSPECPGSPEPQRCRTFNTWRNTTIRNNTIRARRMKAADDEPRGIRAFIQNVGDVIDDLTITGNSVEVVSPHSDTGISLQTGGDGRKTRISNVLIARNEIEGELIAIDVAGGTNRAQETLVENVRVIDNRARLTGGSQGSSQGIVVQSGSDTPPFAIGPPIRYLDDNRVRDVLVRGNVISGDIRWSGIAVTAGQGNGGRRNLTKNVRIIDNVVRNELPTIGVMVETGVFDPYRDRFGADNKVVGLEIKGNIIRLGPGAAKLAGGGIGESGIAMIGGYFYARDSLIRTVRIEANRIRAATVGVHIVGGYGPPAHRNRVVCVHRLRNSIIGARKKISVRSNLRGATGNRVRLSC